MYLHKDNLGSTVSITDSAGAIKQYFSYDAWGKQSAFNGHSSLTAYTSPATSQGYTGHKMMNDVGIIHMGGRIYDPTLGRFLQADPFIQAPKNSQSYNRYSYVLNNPLSYTDPSGYFFKALGKFVKKYWRVIAAAAVTYFTAGAAAGWAAGWGFTGAAAGAVTGAIAGAAGGFVATGSLKGALIGAFSGAAFGAIGASGWNKAGSFAASGAVGGVMTDLQGGKFGHGFWSAGLGSAAGGQYSTDAPVQVLVSAVVGGTISKLTGGKFANGAYSAAFAAALRADWSSNRNAPVGGNRKFLEKNRAALDNELEQVNQKVTRQQGFGSSEDAAEWLHDNAHQLTTKYDAEVGARIYEQSDGSFAVGKIVTSYNRMSVSLGGSSWVGDVYADWHSHPSSYSDTQYIYSYKEFSSDDLLGSSFYSKGFMSTTDINSQRLLFRIPGGGTNANRCLMRGGVSNVPSC